MYLIIIINKKSEAKFQTNTAFKDETKNQNTPYMFVYEM